MLNVDDIYQMAVKKRGSVEAVESVLPKVLSEQALRNKGDDRYLSEMTKRVFQAGFSWKVVEKKWPLFEEQFFHFNPKRCAFISPEEIEERMRNPQLIRHLKKMSTIPLNAWLVDDISKKHNGFGCWLADWPQDDVVSLWIYLKKHGARLGGMSGPVFLRFAGKDTFLLTDDVVQALLNYSVIDKKPISQKALFELQDRFNLWRAESGRPYCEISRLLSLTV